MSHHTRTISASCLLLATLNCLLLPQLRVQGQGAPAAANQTQAGLQPQQPSGQLQLQLQHQLNQIQQQAQRQLGQLNGLVLNAANSSSKYSNVLEAISNVGKAIHQQISASAANPNNVNIMTLGQGAPSGAVNPLAASEPANSKKNEYQSIVTTDQGSFLQHAGGGSPQAVNGTTSANYREQGEFLRQEIMRRAGQLQQVVASSMDLLKNNGDLIVRRLLEQMNVRLDQAKAKADKILMNEPAANNEVAVKALATINMGLNNLNNIISNIVARMDLANKQDQQQQQLQLLGPNSIQQRLQTAIGQPASASLAGQLPPLLDANRLRSNLQQLSQQFHQALNGSQLHQQLSLIRQQRLQQMSLVGGPQNQQNVQQQPVNSKPINPDISIAVRQ